MTVLAPPTVRRGVVSGLVVASLTAAVVSSLGILLVPTIATQFHLNVGTATWILTINLLVGAISTPSLGRLSDGAHPRRVLVLTLAAVLLGSVLAATAVNFGMLVVGRALQGVSYAITPITISLARRQLDAKRVPGAITSLSVTVATGIGLGYPLTGIIAATLDFRFAFWFGAVFALIALVVVVVLVPGGALSAPPAARFDLAGAASLGLGLALLLLGISEGPAWGWASVGTIGSLAGAVVLLVLWVVRELRTRHPLVRLDSLRIPDVVLANGTGLALGAAMYIGISMLSLVAQASRSTGYGVGMPLFWAGFVMLPLAVGSEVASRLSKRFTAAALLPFGALSVAAANVLLAIVHDQLVVLLIGVFFVGLGVAATYAGMPGLIAPKVAASELGSAMSFNQVLRTVGGSLGAAVASAIIAAHLTADLRPTETAVETAFIVSAAACLLLAIGLTVYLRLSARRTRSAIAAPRSAAIEL